MITFDRLFGDPNSNDPYENIAWVREDAEILGADGIPVFSQESVEFPVTWSQRARNIVASKYFYGSGKDREFSLTQLIDRVVDTIADAGRGGLRDSRYFGGETLDGMEAETDFRRELKALLVNQYASFNSPVWFNIGVKGIRQQGSACFINRVEDNMDSILALSMAEGRIFKRGSGAGVNISRLRGKGEPLSGGGTSSGPMSFMKGLDAWAGIIKSGGVTRRAAKMVIMDIDHPDIMAFIRSKQEEEAKARALIDAGYDGSIDGEAYASVFFQNANHSVRLSDEFMEQCAADNAGEGWGPWYAQNRVDLLHPDLGSAENILHEIAATAWSCGDPGVQFSDTINAMHTCPNEDDIYASNPCSEFVFLDNTACNLASINVLKFLDLDRGKFDWPKLIGAVRLLITAQDILVGYSDYPTEDIEKMTKATRPLGLGITNLGALLMTMGLPYDSDEGRDFAAAIMAVVTGEAYRWSAILAGELDPFDLFEHNEKRMNVVIDTHKASAYELAHRINLQRSANPQGLWVEAVQNIENAWDQASHLGMLHGYRNAQVTVIAPTGTISFMMDCDTTGMEPLLAPLTNKTLVGGGVFEMQPKCFEDGRRLVHNMHLAGRAFPTRNEIADHPILATALGDNALSPAGHLRMLAALQPFVSGAISKTINMPADSTIEEVEGIIVQAWQSGVKCVAIYRDGSKGSQPVTVAKEKTTMVSVSNIAAEEGDEAFMEEEIPILAVSACEGAVLGPYRRKLDRTRPSVTHKFTIGGHEGYVTVGLYKDGDVAELFVNMAKEGSTISGLLGQWAMTISLALQYGVPMEVLIEKHSYVRYEPSGFTNEGSVPNAFSITDYIMRWIAANAASFKEGKDPGKVTEQSPGPSTPPRYPGIPGPISLLTQSESVSPPVWTGGNGNVCTNCNGILAMQGTCYVCTTCGDSTGCG